MKERFDSKNKEAELKEAELKEAEGKPFDFTRTRGEESLQPFAPQELDERYNERFADETFTDERSAPASTTRVTQTESVTGRVNRRGAYDELETEHKTWWTTRRKVLIGGTAAATLALIGGTTLLLTGEDSTDIEKDSLELQEQQGWNVGSEDQQLTLNNATDLDSLGGERWHDYLEPNRMLDAYRPASEAWMPFFVPTLIQSLQFPTLKEQLHPIQTPDMAESYGRAQAIARDFINNTENKTEVAIVVDLPGRDAVAFGAGIADAARVVTTFDNYPHPRGVTPSHETLAAMLNYAAEVEGKQSSLAADAPPAFLLDSNRLADYQDAESQFDNRYLAKLPGAEKLKERGIKTVLYITPDRTRKDELDDLNDDFVAYKDANINVAMLPLSDLTPSNEANVIADANGNNSNSNNGTNHYYYGGSPFSHLLFFYYFPFFSPYRAFGSRYGSYYSPNAVSRVASSRAVPVPPRYAPVARPTMFSAARIGSANARGVGRAKPSGFGRATVRVTPSGRVIGTRAGRSGYYSPTRAVSGRSGSFGRGGGVGG